MNYDISYQVYQGGKSIQKGIHTCWLEAVGDAQVTIEGLELSELVDLQLVAPYGHIEVVAEEVVQHQTVLEQPLTHREIQERWDEDGYVEGIVKVETNALCHNTFEDILDLLSERMVGSSLLMDIEFKVVGCTGVGILLVKVSGDASEVVRGEELSAAN